MRVPLGYKNCPGTICSSVRAYEDEHSCPHPTETSAVIPELTPQCQKCNKFSFEIFDLEYIQ